MKKRKIFLFGAIVSLVLAHAYAADLSAYRNIAPILEKKGVQPMIAEISNLNRRGDFVVVDATGTAVPQDSVIVREERIIPPTSVKACMETCVSGNALADGNEMTTFDFPLGSLGSQTGVIEITYAQPLLTSMIAFHVTHDSYTPKSFRLIIDGKPILNTTQGGSARFPEMYAKDVRIEFTYNEPIRFTEVGVGSNKEEDVSSAIRFVYDPKVTYLLYLDSPLGKQSAPRPSINLFAKPREVYLLLGSSYPNPLYKEQDSDGDGVSNSTDNCPMQSNNDQADGNSNGTGDLCDDYDYDGVMTIVDNCQTISNSDQLDTDRDGLGDACDNTESRITEKYPWMSWLVFAFVLIAVCGMGYEVIRKKRGVGPS